MEPNPMTLTLNLTLALTLTLIGKIQRDRLVYENKPLVRHLKFILPFQHPKEEVPRRLWEAAKP